METRIDKIEKERRGSMGDIEEMLKRKRGLTEEGKDEEVRGEDRGDILKRSKKIMRSPKMELRAEVRGDREGEGKEEMKGWLLELREL